MAMLTEPVMFRQAARAVVNESVRRLKNDFQPRINQVNDL
jgi:hypothetical protein